MSTSIKLIVPSNPLKYVFITFDSGWRNVQFYIRGKMVREVTTRSELTQGINFSVEGFGTVHAQIHWKTKELTLIVDNEVYKREITNSERNKSVQRTLIVFGILAFMNLFLTLLCIKNYIERPAVKDLNFMLFCISTFFMASYITSIVFLKRGHYFFYFYGTGLFTFSTIWMIYQVSQESFLITTILTLPRLILLLVLYLQGRFMLNQMRSQEDEIPNELLDENL